MKLDLIPIKTAADRVSPVVAEAVRRYGLEEVVSVAEIDPSLADTESFCNHYEWPPENGANCVVVEARRGDRKWLAACLVLATTRADINKVVRRHLEARKASMAPMEKALEATGMEYGGVTPIGLPEEWPLLVDSKILELEQVLVGGGNRSSKLVFPGKALERLPNAVFLEDLGKPF